jgi:ElaB/YqjD/DUF883 family membrane-anchored ribosome-binding protein
MAPELDESVVRLAAILRQTASQADDLIAAVRREGGERYGAAVRRLERQLKRTNADLQDLEQEAVRGARAAIRAADRVAHEHPYATAGTSAFVGFALGMLLGLALARR